MNNYKEILGLKTSLSKLNFGVNRPGKICLCMVKTKPISNSLCTKDYDNYSNTNKY